MSPRHVKFRFYVDENFPYPAGKFLKSLDHNVQITKPTSKDITDLNQIKTAIKEERILASLDKDFKINASLLELIGKSPGVILIESSDPRSEKIISIFARHLKSLSRKKLKGKVCRLSIDKIIFK